MNWGCSLHVTRYQGDGESRGRTARSRRRGRFSISHMMWADGWKNISAAELSLTSKSHRYILLILLLLICSVTRRVRKIKHDSFNQQINTVINTINNTQLSGRFKMMFSCFQREKKTKPESVWVRPEVLLSKQKHKTAGTSANKETFLFSAVL